MAQIFSIRHHRNPAELHDTSTEWLQHRGFDVVQLYPCHGDLLDCSADAVPTVIHGGGQMVTDLQKHPYLQNEIDWILHCIESRTPVVGICLGAQLIAHALGSTISEPASGACEFGWYPIEPVNDQSFLNAPGEFMQAHFQEFDLPAGAELLATSAGRFKCQAFRSGTAHALQFHPEVTEDILHNWLADDWAEKFWAAPGSQPKEEQLRRSGERARVQQIWFQNFLDQIFVNA